MKGYICVTCSKQVGIKEENPVSGKVHSAREQDLWQRIMK